ncbi:MAG: metal-sensitive transcriptional regulator [Bacillota bacterium]
MASKTNTRKTSKTSSCAISDGDAAADQSGNKQYFQEELLSRLKKIEGQVRGVQKMIQEFRNCGDIVIQLAAIKAAVNRVGNTVLACHLADEIEKALSENRDVKESLEEFMSVFKKFS